MASVLNKKTVTPSQFNSLVSQLRVDFEKKDSVFLLKLEQERIYVPFVFATKFRPTRNALIVPMDYKKCEYENSIVLRNYQAQVFEKSVEILETVNNLLLSAFTGFGKTIFALHAVHKMGLQCLILCPKRAIIDLNWVATIKKYFPTATVQILGSKLKEAPTADFCISSPLIASRIPRDLLKRVGTLVLDEVHLCFSPCNFFGVINVAPKYLIGLSATPYRLDELDKAFKLFFSKRSRIDVPLERKYKIFILETGIKIKNKYDYRNKINWNAVLAAQAENKDRNMTIARIAHSLKNRNVIIMCKRVIQVQMIADCLKTLDEDCFCLFYGNQKKYDPKKRVMVATIQKAGIGFDHPSLDTLILGSDVEAYYLQYIGRIIRKPDHVPWIIDILDNNFVLQKHFNTRKQLYEKHCGELGYVTESDFCKGEKNC